MIVTFRTPAYADIIYMEDVAKQLLKLMGRDDTIPSAMYAKDIPKALAGLRKALDVEPRDDDRSMDDSSEKPVSLRQRVVPLIELLEASSKDQVDVMWGS